MLHGSRQRHLRLLDLAVVRLGLLRAIDRVADAIENILDDLIGHLAELEAHDVAADGDAALADVLTAANSVSQLVATPRIAFCEFAAHTAAVTHAVLQRHARLGGVLVHENRQCTNSSYRGTELLNDSRN